MPPFPIFSIEQPALRPVEMIPAQHQGQPVILVRDPLQVLEGTMVLAPDPLLLLVMQLADGQRDLATIAREASLAAATVIPEALIREVVEQLDEALLLLTPRFAEAWDAQKSKYAQQPTRKSTVFQSKDKLLLLKQLGEEFRRHAAMPGSPKAQLDLTDRPLRAVLTPHIDYQRGGEVYLHGFRAIAERTKADTFIILGTLHRTAMEPFIATTKPFETPLGTVQVAEDVLDQIAKDYGGELFEEAYLHAQEHTIELQVVYLQQVLKDRPFKIVPILVSSFEDLLATDPPIRPGELEAVENFVKALRKALERLGDRGMLIGGVDFSHCGPDFGDEERNTAERQKAIRDRDERMLKVIEGGDADAFFDFFRPDLNETKVCSISPIYTLLKVLDKKKDAKTMAYKQAVDAKGDNLVSFATVAFQDKGPKILLSSR